MEGPSLIILREEANKFVGKRVLSCAGSLTRLDFSRLAGKKLSAMSSWGKHFLISLETVTLRVHFLMFGSYSIDRPKPDKLPKLSLVFRNGEIHFYSCSIQPLTEAIDELYDWRVDVMSDRWDENRVLRLVNQQPDDTMLCDLLLDQSIFAGSGNIIKNEVLFNLGLQPETKLRTLLPKDRRAMIREVRAYSLQFYIWKKAYVLRKNWRVYRRRLCAVCGRDTVMTKTGKLNRVSFHCPKCQKLRKRLPARS